MQEEKKLTYNNTLFNDYYKNIINFNFYINKNIQLFSDSINQKINSSDFNREIKSTFPINSSINRDALLVESIKLKASQPITLLTDLREKLEKASAVSRENANRFIQQLDQLLNTQDELITLMLENSAIDFLFHRLTLALVPPLRPLLYGEFIPQHKLIKIYDHPLANFDRTMIHELTHAVCFFAFMNPPNFLSSTKQVDRFGLFKQIMMNDGLPCPLNSHNEPFNPAYLKFRHCVKTDVANSKKHHKVFAQFFNMIEKSYETNILDKKGLSEIFSFYMEVRLELFKNNSKENALAILEENLPCIHAYFETDMKKVLERRIRHYQSLPHMCLISKCVQPPKKNVIHDDYQKDGTLKFKNSRF